MWDFFWPIMLVVGANVLYNICAKSTPQGVNAFASLSVTYLVAFTFTVLMFFITGTQKNIAVEVAKTNWTSWVFGFSLVALEVGYIFLYRAGWRMSTGSLVANISLACILLVVGFFAYKEVISLKQIIGVVVCIAGLFLITK